MLFQFPPLKVYYGHFSPFLGAVIQPPYGLMCAKGPHMDLDLQIHYMEGVWGGDKAYLLLLFTFFGFRLPLKYALMPHFCAFKPPPWPKVPTRSPYGLVTLNPCFLRVLVKNWSLSVNFGDVFSISHSGGLFLAIFSLFWGCYRAPL